MPGLHLYDLMRLPIGQLRTFFADIAQRHGDDPALELILSEVQTRLDFLCRVGVDYLHLDRQSRTLSGGEVQRINLTTALGSSLVNTLFVLDEPSKIGRASCREGGGSTVVGGAVGRVAG